MYNSKRNFVFSLERPSSYVPQASLKLESSASWVLGLQMCVPHPSHFFPLTGKQLGNSVHNGKKDQSRGRRSKLENTLTKLENTERGQWRHPSVLHYGEKRPSLYLKGKSDNQVGGHVTEEPGLQVALKTKQWRTREERDWKSYCEEWKGHILGQIQDCLGILEPMAARAWDATNSGSLGFLKQQS